jgi:hypothetical protein
MAPVLRMILVGQASACLFFSVFFLKKSKVNKTLMPYPQARQKLHKEKSKTERQTQTG